MAEVSVAQRVKEVLTSDSPVDGSIALGVRGVSKRYANTQALDDVSVDVRRGESVALIGANGAGKSTLVRILTGAVKPDSGDVIIDGEVQRISTPREARKHGVGFVQQELAIADDLTVAENILAGGWHHRGPMVATAPSRRAVIETCERVGLDVAPEALAGKLSPAAKRLVMICRSLVVKPSTLILDEPTATLADFEADRIVDVFNQLRGQGLSLVYISHRMEEISHVCDLAVVLRNGRVVMTTDASPEAVRHAVEVGISSGETSKSVFGADVGVPPVKAVSTSPIALKCTNLVSPVLRGVDLQVHEGEIVGLAGLLGSGRTEILRAIAGADRLSGGDVEVFGETASLRSPSDAIRYGIGLIPEDRRNQGGLLGLSISENLVLPDIPSRRGWLRRKAERAIAMDAIERFRIKCDSPDVALNTLSGGNQQKVILARWILKETRVLLLDEPTAGIDVVAKRELMGLVRSVTGQGRAALMVSSELDELCEYCDRIYVVQNGAISAETSGDIAIGDLVHLVGSRATLASSGN
ncbi:MAG: sugar ABC transporter ATP-binding protein [Microthrixaceae bacterium]